MSRNKDKHEGANNRSYHIMSEAERASGRRGGWTSLEVTGGVRALAPQLFQLTHLTALYLNDNSLQRIPPDINLLVNLHQLDISNNKLRSLPAELGDLIQLRELLLHNNYLRVLPYELGKLFHLQMLGLQGNPLGKEMLSIYNDSNGTTKLRTYMLDNLQVDSLALNLFLKHASSEPGQLFHLQMLGLQGNPLGKEMLSIYNDSNGTTKLRTYIYARQFAR
ncbi:CCR4-NOT transcription complex subunit 6-like [Plutella xylostella]|uniref:CCR4-NOT transcription complex subunit 6-like n=1 Tax=Plutella xylostella TaxID=51655 RepID=A0ABQ7QXL7_PLUXY|nr:CCR4-NOT transcription complex subunit 6-like [Plutella xylostella]